jgi:hypothetical protein
MTVYWKAFLGALAGKLFATLFIAICLLLGFGPDQWAEFMIEGLPTWITPAIAQSVFLILGILTLARLVIKPTSLKITRDEKDKLCLAVVAVRTKVLNHESFETCKDKLIEKYKYLKEYEAVFEETKYKQDYRDFMHSAGIAISENKRYLNREEEDWVLDLMRKSSEKLEKVLK